MNVYRSVFLLAGCWFLFAAQSTVLAQAPHSGGGGLLQYVVNQSKPEGVAPPSYCSSGDVWLNQQQGDPDPSSGTAVNCSQVVTLQWGGAGGPARTIINSFGPLPYDGSHGGYHYSFDLTADAMRGFGANSQVVFTDRANNQVGTSVPGPYVLGTTDFQASDPSGTPIAGVTVSICAVGSSGLPDFTLSSSAVTGPSGHVVFGQPLSGSSDAPYAPGLASDNYVFVAKKSGLADVTYYPPGPGGSLSGLSFAVTMSPSSSSIAPGGPGSSGGSCVSSTYAPSPTDGGGSGGISAWQDGSFPAAVTGTYLHSGNWSVTINVTVAGQYSITGDCPTAGNIGTLTPSVAGVVGPVVNCTSPSQGALLAAPLGTYTLAAGANTLTLALSQQQFGAVKTFHIVPTSTCGASSGGGGGSSPDVTSFVTGFWKKLQDFFQSLFTIDPADLQALKTSSSRLATYGPLGVPSAVISEFTDAFGSTYTGVVGDGSQADYWVIPLNSTDLTNATASLNAHPEGYVGGYVAPATPGTIYNTILPSQLDLTPYASYILIGRRVALVMLWLYVAFALVSRFTPELRI